MTNIDVGGDKITGLGQGTSSSDAVTYSQLQSAITSLNGQISAINTALGNLTTDTVTHTNLTTALNALSFLNISLVQAWTPGVIPNLAGASISFVLLGATLSDLILASFSLNLPSGVFLIANVQSFNNVQVTLLNLSGSSQTIGAGTIKVGIIR